MDAFIVASKLFEKRLAQTIKEEEKEMFSQNKENILEPTKAEGFDPFTFIYLIMSIIVSIVAAQLSWSCNTLAGYPCLLKIFFSFVAFLMGPLYIILHLVFRADLCIIGGEMARLAKKGKKIRASAKKGLKGKGKK